MNRWKPKACAVRILEDHQVRLLLRRGGMLMLCGGKWVAWRNHDPRRMRIGVVPDALARQLEAEGFVCRLDGPSPRLCAGPRCQA